MPQRLKLVIFDLDGTLVNAYPAIVESFNFTMEKMRCPKQKNIVIKRAVGWGDKNLISPFVPKDSLNKALAVYRRHHQKSLKGKTRFLPGAKNLLLNLKKKNCLLAIASNRPRKFSHIILEYLKIKRYFDCILCGDEVKKPKPHPGLLLKILKKLSVNAKDAVYVGDMTVDVVAGRRAGLATIALTTGSSTRKELSRCRPYAISRHLRAVDAILRSYNAE